MDISGRKDLRGANLQGADLKKDNLEQANLIEVNLEQTNLIEVNLKEANLEGVSLEAAFLEEAYDLSLDRLYKVKPLYNSKLDEKIFMPLKDKYPALFEKSNYNE